MKRRILSILLLCSMVLTTLPATAFAEEGQEAPIQETPVCSCETACTEEGMNADCPVCGAEGAAPEACEKYVPATEAAEDEPEPEPEQQPEGQPEEEPEPPVQAPAPAVQSAEGAGMPVTYAAAGEVSTEDELKTALGDSSVDTIKLTQDVTLTETEVLTARGDTTLDLNGKVLNLNSKQITVNRDTLTLSDSNPNVEHKFKEDATGLWVLDNSGDKTVRGGVITGGKATNGGGVCVQRTGKLIMTGSNIVGCTATKGGGVYIGGTGNANNFFTMEGGSIVGCTASSEGGGVCVAPGKTFTMEKGSIKSCKVTSSANSTFGGGVCVRGTFTMTGGEITGCRVAVGSADCTAMGGGVHVDGTFNMGGTAKITSCISGSDFGNGVYISGTMTMDGGEISNCNDEWHIWGVYITGCLDARGGKIKNKVFSSGGTIKNSGTSGGTVFEASVENNITTNPDGSFASASTISGGHFKDKVTNVARCTISGGIFEGQVTNSGTISDGTFKNRVTNNTGSTIDGGTFEGQVTNNGTINNGTFKGEVTNNGTMTGGTSEKGVTGNKPQNTKFTVTFDTDGGSTAPAAQYFLSDSGKVAKPADPTKAGYAFINWYNGDTEYDFSQTVTEDLNLKAHWLKTIPGKGTEESPYQISNAEDLQVFRDIVNGTDGQTKKTDAWGELTNDIDLSGEDWTPIGKMPESAENQDLPYKGNFNGNGHTISGLTITGNIKYAGLFGYINGATIADVTLKDGSISTTSTTGTGTYAGGIVAFAQGGTITGCGNENPVTGGSFTCVGGIVGAIYDSIKIDRSYNTGTIAGTSDNNLKSRVGGLIGSSFSNNPEVIDCYNTGAVRTGEYVGGLSGYTEGSDCRFFSCYNIGSVTDGTHVGDITGDKAHCYSCYHLKTSNNNYGNGQSEEAESKTAEEFANGTVLKLLKENNGDKRTGGDPWDTECKYLPAAGKTLPVFARQNLTTEHTHVWSDWTSNGDNTHTRSCTVCFETETKDCHGGTATCTAKAQCEDCQAEYGELAAHQFTAETVAESYLASAATCTEPAVYYTSCAACGAKGTEIFTVGDPLDHDWGDWTSNGDGTHTRTCSRDATHTDTGDCTGGTATCMAKAECETCGGAYGETDPDNHADGCYPEWTISKTHHQEKYTLCGQVLVAQEEHTFGDWNVTKKATTKQKGEQERTCQVCEYHQFETIPVESDQDGKDNKDNGKTTKATKTTKAAKDAKNGSPKTGDSSSVPLWTALLCVSAVGVTGTVLSRKRKRTK